MKKTLLALLALSLFALASCSKSATYNAVQSATNEAIAALDTVTSPVSVAQVVAMCGSACTDAITLNGEMKSEETEAAKKLYDELQSKASAKSDSLTRIILNEMIVTQDVPAEPQN